MAFKDVLRKLRRREGLTQAALGEALGTAKSTISMYERGEREPDLARLKEIAAYFQVDVNRLLDIPPRAMPVPEELSLRAVTDPAEVQRRITALSERQKREAQAELERAYGAGAGLPRPLRGYALLNDSGKQKVAAYIEGLLESPRFRADAGGKPD